MRIYTKTGDKGKTFLFGGCPVCKNDKRLGAAGTTDELNSWLGVLRGEVKEDLLGKIQNDLMIIGSLLGGAGEKLPLFSLEKRIKEMEDWIDKNWQKLPKLDNFIIPGGTKTSCFVHLSRVVCRRAEREVVRAKADGLVAKYLNRLSDFLFVLARKVNLEGKGKEVIWRG